MPDALRPEDDLLLACARTQPDAATADHIRALSAGPLDWPALLQVAERHGVLPLLYWNLNAAAPEAVPAELREPLRARFQENARINLFLTGELHRVLGLCAQHGIPAIPYKGPVLTASIYGNLALRHFNDLDILVRRDDVLRARDLLVAQGFHPEVRLTPAQEPAFLLYDREYHLRNDVLSLELHWETAAQYFSWRPGMDSAWGRLQHTTLGGLRVVTLAPEDLLLTLCAHGAMHVWEQLKWVCDIAELLRARPSLDWDIVLGEARRLHSTRILWLGLALAHDLLDAPLPGNVLSAIRADPGAAPLAAEVRRRLFAPAPPPLRKRQEYWFYLRARERLRDRIAYAARLALRPNALDCRLLSLPRPLFFVYYLLRPFRLIATYVFGAVRRN